MVQVQSGLPEQKQNLLKEIIIMNDSSEKFLKLMLEGYKQNLEGVEQYLTQTNMQLADAASSKDEMLEHIKELEDLLGIEEGDEDEAEEAKEA